MASSALTFRDVENRLREEGVDNENLGELKQLFDRCEAGRYAGGAGTDAEPKNVAQQALNLVKKLERNLKS